MASNTVPATVAYGDGIDPEIMNPALHIIKEAAARLEAETIEIGEKVYLRGVNAGIEPRAWTSLRRTTVSFKSPITTPQGEGFKSPNETTGKTLRPGANVMAENGKRRVTHQQVGNLLGRVQEAGFDSIKIESLYIFDGQKGFVASQDE